MTDKILSVITVTYNAANFLPKTIKSFQSRINQQIEYILVDGLSNDSTLEIASQHKNVFNQIVSEKDKGIYDAMNKGVTLAKGKYIIFINAGDEFIADLDFILPILNNSNSLIYGNVNLQFEDGKIKTNGNKVFSIKEFMHKMPICHQSLFYLKSEFIPYSIDYKIIADRFQVYELMKNLGIQRFEYVNHNIATYPLGGENHKQYKRHMEEEKLFLRYLYQEKTISSWFQLQLLIMKSKIKLFLFNTPILTLYRKFQSK